jgi:simple sugar transport system ATP-binding protein
MATQLQMIGITKRFSGVLANDAIDFDVRPGEVHALLGENGAGKSTLVSILYGLLTPTSGKIVVNGRAVRIHSSRAALALGIGMVHQHFMLIPALTVVENLVLGVRRKGGPVLDLKAAAGKISELAALYGLKVDPWAKVAQLSVGEQQRVEILKALFRGADLLILDEPTAVLTPKESEDLFRVIRRLTAEGRSVIFITHKLHEVMAVSHRVTALRGGRAVGTVVAAETNEAELARLMVGRDVVLEVKKAPAAPGAPVLEVRDLKVTSQRGLPAVKGVSLTVHAGEILAIAGVDGNGQAELMEAIAGLKPVAGGRVAVGGVDLANATPRRILETGVGHIPADRHERGLALSMTLAENLVLQTFHHPPFRRGLLLDWGAIRSHARRLLAEYDVKAAGEDELAQFLSGGNQQKLIVARELSRQPHLLLAMHPTRGLDVGATEFVHGQIIRARDAGCAVLLVSTELEEVMSLGDRISVMFEGEIVDTLLGGHADRQELGLLMAGSRRQVG